MKYEIVVAEHIATIFVIEAKDRAELDIILDSDFIWPIPISEDVVASEVINIQEIS